MGLLLMNCWNSNLSKSSATLTEDACWSAASSNLSMMFYVAVVPLYNVYLSCGSCFSFSSYAKSFILFWALKLNKKQINMY